MDNIIWGFDPDISKYSLKEVCFYILTFSILVLLMGKYLEEQKIGKKYLKLIRYNKISHYWHVLCLKIICLSFIEITCLFLLIIVGKMIMGQLGLKDNWYMAYILWTLGFYTISMILLLLINYRRCEKFSFLLIILVEVLSLYGSSIFGQNSHQLPGDFIMINRSNLILQNGYPVSLVVIVQFLLNFVMAIFGYRFSIRRK
jgi:hypothetical protein